MTRRPCLFYFLVLGSSALFTYVTPNGPMPRTWISVAPFAIAKWRGF